MRYVCIALLIAAVITGCATKQSVLNTDALPVQTFTINPAADTAITTKQGCIIHIAAGSIKNTGNQNLSLTVKEAITAEQILLSGLTTVSNGRPLSSGGMVYINADNAEIIRPLKISIPANTVQAGMQLFKGDEKDGTINWINPAPLGAYAGGGTITKGQALFAQHCSSCHSATLVNNATGPLLWNIQNRRRTQWLDSFILNSSKQIAKGDRYAYSIYAKYNKQVMTKFERTLTRTDLDNIYAFIQAKSAEADLSKNKDVLCEDSCYRYAQLLQSMGYKVQHEFYNADAANSNVYYDNNENESTGIFEAGTNDSNYVDDSKYDFAIMEFGWFNVDIITSDLPSALPTNVAVTVSDKNVNDLSLHLFIPSLKINIYNINKGKDGAYSFDRPDFYMLQNIPAYVVAFKEAGDKILFGITAFNIKQQNNIAIILKQDDPKVFEEALKGIAQEGDRTFKNINVQIQDATGADSIIINEANSPAIKTVADTTGSSILQKAAYLKPVTCSCGGVLRVDQ